MQNVVTVATTAAVCLLAAQACLVLLRVRSCVRRSVPVLLAALLFALALHVATPRLTAAHELVGSVLLWASGAFLIQAVHRGSLRAWTGAVLAFACSLVLARTLGLTGSVPYRALRSFGIVLLSSVPLGITIGCWQRRHSGSALATLISGALLAGFEGTSALVALPAGAIEALSPLPVFLLTLSTAWLVFQEGYPGRPAWRESLPGLASREGMLHALHARLLETEDALAGNERITTAGFLALGAAHEFKNVLSLIRLTAAHGLGRDGPGEKDACFHLIVEHTNTARDSALDVLGRLSASREGEPVTIDAKDLAAPIRRAGAGLRADGIVVETDLDAGVSFRARRCDVEQIVLNLVHNAADSYRRCPRGTTMPIVVSARNEDDRALIEVRDSAGGVDDGIRLGLFHPPRPGTGGSGLGLYLSRSLALSNRGSLEYRPLEGGSVFSLGLPAVRAGGQSDMEPRA